MKNVLRCLLVSTSLVFMFMLGVMYASLDNIYTKRNWDANEKYFQSMNIETFVDKSCDDEEYNQIVIKLEGILEENDVVDDVKVDERLVKASSAGSFGTKKQNINYTILRVHFTFINDNNVEDDMFIYFYYEKVNYDRYSLLDVSASEYVTIK